MRMLHFCPICLLKGANWFQVICGDCIIGSVSEGERGCIRPDIKAWCPKNDHFAVGVQEAHELFGLDCSICLEKAAEKFDQPRRRRYRQEQVDRIRTPCGKHRSVFERDGYSDEARSPVLSELHRRCDQV